VPQAEKEFLAGVKAQYNSEVAYSSLQAELDEQGVIFVRWRSAAKTQ
jgi:Fe-S cluster assembly protein SufB